MRRHLSRIWKFLKNGWVITIIVVIAAIVLYAYTRAPKSPSFETATAEIGNILEQVSVTGAVSPIGKADLAFEKSGVIKFIGFKVGDKVKRGDVIARLDDASDRAAVASAQATLSDMSRSLTPQELAVQETAVASAETTLDNAKKDALNAAHDAFVKTQGAVFNYTDTFFDNPQSANPTINVRTPSSAIQLRINNSRVAINDALNAWNIGLQSATSDDATNILSKSKTYLSTVKGFMDDLSAIVNDLNPGNSGLSQSVITSYVTTMNTGLASLYSAIDSVSTAQASLSSAQSALEQAKSSYSLKLSGNSSQSISAQAAKVAAAQAELSKDILVSPIDGIVTKADPNLGEFVAAGASGFAVQNADFKIEAYVPEADIAKVKVGDMASSTLDAYGAYVDFPAVVTTIDPAETVLEGVPTYKVTLQFVTPDARIRSGMTSNLEILTNGRSDVLNIPYRAIVITATTTTVRLVSADGKSYSSVPVVTGLKGSDGTIEIVSGLSPGDKVVTYVK